MGHPIRSMSRGAVLAVLGVMVAGLSLLVLWAANGQSATSLASWQDHLATDRTRLVVLREQLADTRSERAKVRADYDRSLVRFRQRLVSIYKAGGTGTVHALLSTEVTPGQVIDMAEAMTIVAEHDAKLVRHFRAVARRIPALDRREQRILAEIADARRDIARDIRMIEHAKAEAAAARARAREMARIADAPLTPRAVAPETVAERTAATVDPEPAHEEQQQAQPSGYSQTGQASVYAAEFAGKPTSSGEPYDPSALTAAHPSLPLGTWVLVAGPGGSALVRINDRGPFVGGRIIDLSAAAAAATGVNGLAQVTITVQS